MPRLALPASAIAAALTLSGCELIGDIFQAGMWVGVILVVAVIAGVGYVITKLFK